MDYSLTRLRFGTSQSEKICDIDSDLEIRDICVAKDLGFIFVDTKSIGIINKDGAIKKEYINGLNGATSITYSLRFHKAYIFEAGMNLKIFDVALRSLSDFLGKTYQYQLLNKLSRIKDFKVDSVTDSHGKVYAVNSAMHQCLIFRDSEYRCFAGRGISNYSVSNKISECSFSSPSGIAYYSGNFYISDTGNHCIRKISNKSVSIVVGNPKDSNDIVSPSKIRIKDNIAYFMDRDNVLCMSMVDFKYSKVYESKNLITIDIDKNKDLVMLERKDA